MAGSNGNQRRFEKHSAHSGNCAPRTE